MQDGSHSLPTPTASTSGSGSTGSAAPSGKSGPSGGSCDPRDSGDNLLSPSYMTELGNTAEPADRLRVPYRLLNTGAVCPGIGYGTGGEGRSTPEELYTAIRVALECGYRSFDVAPFYQDGLIEQTVGRAIRESDVPRSDVFLATKVWPTFSRCPEQSLELSLSNLGMDYVDLLLLHWPIPLRPVPGDVYALGGSWDASWDFKKTWARMQQIPRSRVRAIGLCNFTVNRLELLLASPTTTVVPAVLQVEGHPELPQKSLMQYCRRKGIQVFCFSPLAQGQVSNPIIQHVANHYAVDAGQVALSWAVQRGTVPLPKSTNPRRIRSNLALVQLHAEALELLDRLGEHPRRIVNPRIFFGHDIFENNIDSYPTRIDMAPLDDGDTPSANQSTSNHANSRNDASAPRKKQRTQP